MATTLRELVTRFRFETSEADFRGFNQKLNSMKSGLNSLASVFGITLGVSGAVAIGRMGLAATQAKVQLQYLAGSDAFTNLRRIFDRVQTQLEGIRAGSSRLFRREQFDQAAAGFVRVFGTGEVKMRDFEKIWRFATVQSGITGRNVTEIVDEMTRAVQSGGFESLLDIPGLTEFRRQMLEFQQGIIDPKEPGFEIARLNRMRMLVAVLDQASTKQDKFLHSTKLMPQQLLSAAEVANKMRESLQRIGESFDRWIIPAMEKLIKFLDYFMVKFGIMEKGVKMLDNKPAGGIHPQGGEGRVPRIVARNAVGGYMEEKGRELLQWMHEDSSKKGRQIDLLRGDLYLKLSREQIRDYIAGKIPLPDTTQPGASPETSLTDKEGLAEISRDSSVNIGVQNNHINVTASDPVAAGREIQKKLEETYKDARAQNLPVEGR